MSSFSVEDRVLRFTLQMDFDSIIGGWSLVRDDPRFFGFQSESTGVSGRSVQQLIMVKDLFHHSRKVIRVGDVLSSLLFDEQIT